MISDSGSPNQNSDYAKQIQEVLDKLHQMQQTPQLATTPETFEALEHEIRQYTDHLGSLLLGHHLQQALDCDALHAEQDDLVRHWPKALKNDGRVQVWVRTAQGGGRAGVADLLPPQGQAASRSALRWRLCGSGALGDIRSLHSGIGG